MSFNPQKFLASMGYTGQLNEMVSGYQELHGLTVDGKLGPKTERLMQNPRRCGCPDRLTSAATLCRWNTKDVTYHAELDLSQYTRQQAYQLYVRACNRWNSVCGINLQPSTSSPMIYAVEGSGRRWDFDGPGGVLAWSELPCSRQQRQLQQAYDRDERWSDVLLYTTMLHELGHALGLDHLQRGTLMAAYSDPSVTDLTQPDIDEAQRRYGPPVTDPGPVDPGNSANGRITFEAVIGGTKYLGTADLSPVG